ncbi:baseplate J/gp47 family protein [Aneurinibacillus sp. Ricciae_BoGa-3]|uniref:baseplate J/gp47 family protein n=1 Tax=Aneurinibacillus sp. Ricciae_BoGa-3 TaxID=3022697 RepID=UPI0023413053|nr:baseplate J/gp47 family protein [Aneurinibacillus sp. Ricciae_BoGa-3]WCK53830.1 baseplate J/gp47 family protein [Aneurinibacillus sp. Ricciae_BoGa-3]
MPDFQFKTADDITADILQYLTDAGTPVTDWSSGSSNRTFWELVAKLGSDQQYMLERLLNLFFADSDELTDSYLDRRVMERGLTRKIGTQASGSLTLSRSTPAPFDILVPAGTVFSTVDRTVSVETSQDVTMVNGQQSVTVNVTASDIGAAGNLVTNTSLIQSGVAIMGVESIVVASPGLSGGANTETDDELRARYIEDIQHPENGGSISDYIRWAKQVSGVESANCIELARGPGTTDVVILSANGLPSSDLITSVQNYVNTKKPTCADVLVRGPQAVVVDITLTYWTDSVSPLEQTITDAIQKYITSVGVGGTVRVSQIYNIVMDIPEIKDMTLTAPTQNLVLTQDQIAELGHITLTKGT